LRAVDVILDEEAALELNKLSEPKEAYWKVRSGLRWN
jgi:hypothetical protein